MPGKSPIKLLADQFNELIWLKNLNNLPPWRRRLVISAQVISATLRDVMDGQLTMRAMSLVYTTILSIVPMLALSFSVLKSMGVHNQLEPLLINFLAPLGEKGALITEQVINFVENMKVGVLGTIGLAFLIFTVISLVQKIETAFNYIWQISRQRSFTDRFSRYLSVIIIGPVFIFTALGIKASVMGSEALQSVSSISLISGSAAFFADITPYIIIICSFTFVFMFVPNTKVKFMPSIISGITCGILWELISVAFTEFVTHSTSYTAVYSSFAIIMLLFIWLYVNWILLLFGGNLTYYIQHTEQTKFRREGWSLSNRRKEHFSIASLLIICKKHIDGGPLASLDTLVSNLGLPASVMAHLVGEMETQKLIVRVATEPTTWVPAKSVECMSLQEVIQRVRESDESAYFSTNQALPSRELDAALEIEDEIYKSIPDISIKALITKVYN